METGNPSSVVKARPLPPSAPPAPSPRRPPVALCSFRAALGAVDAPAGSPPASGRGHGREEEAVDAKEAEAGECCGRPDFCLRAVPLQQVKDEAEEPDDVVAAGDADAAAAAADAGKDPLRRGAAAADGAVGGKRAGTATATATAGTAAAAPAPGPAPGSTSASASAAVSEVDGDSSTDETIDKDEAVVHFPLSADRALARLLSALGLGNDGGEASWGEEAVEGPTAAGVGEEENEDDHADDDEGASSDGDSFSPPPRALLAPLRQLPVLPGVVLYRSAVLHGDGAGGDGALVRRRWRERGGVHGGGDKEHAAEEEVP